MAGRHAWQGACVVGGHVGQGDVHGRGACMARDMHGRGHAWQGVVVHGRAVRILLECILVYDLFLQGRGHGALFPPGSPTVIKCL